jgi:chorismate dehydratase
MITLGVVSYLNALPLYRTLEASGQVKVLRAVPALLAQMLENRECDAAIMPVVDYFRGTGSQIISDACIGTKPEKGGIVQSVLLFHKTPLHEVQTVAADTSSHSSVALTRVLLGDVHGITPPFYDHAPNLPAMLEAHDAAVIIGDAALEAARDHADVPVVDLGAAWMAHTGLPFVFAAWIARDDLEQDAARELGALLNAARDEGEADIAGIVANKPFPSSLSDAQIEDYLQNAVEFHISPDHRAAIERFRARCTHYNLL